MIKRVSAIASIFFLIVSDVAPVSEAGEYNLDWLEQYRDSGRELASASSVTVDGSGDVIVGGNVYAGIGTGGDGLVRRFDATGDIQNTTMFQRSSVRGVSTNEQNQVFVVGHTSDSLAAPFKGQLDIFVSRIDDDGSIVWTRQLGTPEFDIAFDVAADGKGNVFVGGHTGGKLDQPDRTFSGTDNDAFVMNYDVEGNLLWTHQFGSKSSETVSAIWADGLGNAYFSGWTRGDAYLSKIDSRGNILWTSLIATPANDEAQAVHGDNQGNIYVGGNTRGALDGLNYGDEDAFLARFDVDGNIIWASQIGTSATDVIGSISVNSSGRLIVGGSTRGDLAGMNHGKYDAFLAEFSSFGDLVWMDQFGTDGSDGTSSVVSDIHGSIYAAGTFYGAAEDFYAGLTDAWVAKFIVPEPAGLTTLLVGTLIAVLSVRLRWDNCSPLPTTM